jgi:hypothetical protein
MAATSKTKAPPPEATERDRLVMALAMIEDAEESLHLALGLLRHLFAEKIAKDA